MMISSTTLESVVNAAGHLTEKKLKPVFGPDQAIRVKAHFAVYPERHAKRPAVEAFLIWLHAEAAKTQEAVKIYKGVQ